MTSEQDPDKNFQSEILDEGEGGYYEDMEDDMYYQSDSARMGGEEAEEANEESIYSHLGESSDDPEQKRCYMEYLSLMKEIDCQNQMVEDIKAQISELCAKPCKTKCEMKDIKRLRVCMEQEVIKLRCLMTKAMNLQNFGSRRRYHDIPIATTIDEANMTPYARCSPQVQDNWKGNESSETDKCANTARKEEREDKALRCLCKALGKMKICCPEDKRLVEEIAGALFGHKKRKSPPPCPPFSPSIPCLPPCQGPCPPFPKHSKKSKHKPCSSESMPGADSLERLKQQITCMQSSVGQLKKEIYRRERDKQKQQCFKAVEEKEDICSEEPDPIQVCLGKRTAKADEMAKLRENYLHLLSEFSKKDCQLKEMEKRLKGFCGSCNDGRNEARNVDQSELIVLRQRVGDMKEEQTEFKCLMKEQSQQLEEYRNKYLVAQQKVEEQSVTLEKLNMNNKRIEKQINTEVKEIRAKFQEKLNELLHFPKLLENEQLKLAQACKEKEDLQGKLMLVCKELKALKAQMEAPKDDTDCRPQLIKCQMELEQCKTRLEEMERQRDLFCEQLKSTQDDLDTLRSESAKIIARTKERAEATRCQMQEQIDRLEKELAQCRATACLSVSDREAVIREMQGQLNTLSYSFDAAQKQIKTLRNHIAYVSNENCFPVKC